MSQQLNTRTPTAHIVKPVHANRSAAFAVVLAVASPYCLADKINFIEFDLVPNPAVVKCLAKYPDDPQRQPQAHLQIYRGNRADVMSVQLRNIKPDLKFDLFTVERSPLDANKGQVKPFSGFGLSWYQTDLDVNKQGYGQSTIKTVLLDQIFGFDQENQESDRAPLPPINTFHVGFWFNDPKDTEPCGINVVTPFNGEHHAGPLAMISIPDADTGLGPLCTDPNVEQHPAVCNP